jgi:hypothetical protein
MFLELKLKCDIPGSDFALILRYNKTTNAQLVGPRAIVILF